MKKNKKLKDLICSLKDKVNELDYEAIVDTKRPDQKDIASLLEDIAHLTLLIKVELVGIQTDRILDGRSVGRRKCDECS